jgi:hypothetical protein
MPIREPTDGHPDDKIHGDEFYRSPNPISPHHIGHPTHDGKWLELARALGRIDARKDFESIHGKAPPDGPKIKTRYRRT